MSLDTIQHWALAIVPAAFGGLGWLVKRLSTRMSEVEAHADKAHEALAAHRLHVAETYVTREALRETEARLVTHLERIENKLDAQR